MIQVQTKLSKGHQLTLPSAIRKAMSIGANSPITLIYDKGTLTLKKAETPEENLHRVFRELDEWRENLPQSVKDNIKKHAGWTANQYREYIDNLPETQAYRKEKYGI